MEVVPFSERELGATLDFAARVRQQFPFSWAGREALLRWKYLEQVQRPAAAVAPVWILRDGDRVRGFLGAMLYDFWCTGQDLSGAAAMDFYLEPECRGRGLGQQLLQAYEAAARVKLMILSTPQAHRIYLQRGYAELKGVHACYGIWGLSGLARWLGHKALRRRYACVPPESADRLRDWLLARPGVGLAAAAEAPALDAFLRRAQERYDFAPRRTLAYLLWKYRQHPDRHGEVFTLREAGALKGVFAFANRQREGPPLLALGDHFLADPQDEASIHRLLDFSRRLTGLLGAHATVMLDPGSALGRALRTATLTRVQPLLCSLKIDGEVAAIELRRSYLSAGDGDFIR
jgi:GNAT superfamily N-acetyltransferase